MSKRTAARAAAITAALAKLSNSWGERKERQRMEKLRAYQEQIAASQLRQSQFEESTRPTIEQKLADLERQRTASKLALESGQYEFGQRKKEDEEKSVDRDYTLKSRLTPEQQQALNRQRVAEGDIDIETKTEALARSKRPKPVERRRLDEIAKSIGVDDEALREAVRALEESGDDHGKAIEALSRPDPTTAGQDDSLGTTNGADPRADGRLLIQRARREWAASGEERGGALPPNAARKRTEAQVDAVSMRSAMQANAMIQNPQAPFEEKAQSWLTLERLGILKAPEEVKDWVRLGHKTQEQIAETQRAKGPPAQETRVPSWMGRTSTAEDRAAIAERAKRRESMSPHDVGGPLNYLDPLGLGVVGRLIDFATPSLRRGATKLADYASAPESGASGLLRDLVTPVGLRGALSAYRARRHTGPMNDYPPESARPVESRRIAGQPYARPQIGPPYPGVDPEQSRQMDLDAFMQSQQEMAPQPQPDPLQVMFDRIRELRESLSGASRDPSGQGF